MRHARRQILATIAALTVSIWVTAAAAPAQPLAKLAAKPPAKLPAVDPTSFGGPAAVHFIDHDKVAATMVKGGAIVSDPGLTILANRRGAGQVEYHDHTSHIFIMVEGEATLITGGTMIDAKRTAADQMVATGIEGGEVHHMTKGDVITIPAKTPHWWKEVSTGTVAYYAVNIESK
jgi:mannose-6-phosphate isomerase-like protein (cupin superfamily)